MMHGNQQGTTSPRFEHGRCGGDSHNQDGGNNNSDDGDNDRENNNKQRERPEQHETMPRRSTDTCDKLSSARARETMDQQSKVFDTGTKKPGGKDYAAVAQKRIERLRQNMSSKATQGRGKVGDERLAKDVATDAVGQQLHPAVRSARVRFYDKVGPTVNQVIDKVKKVSRWKKKKKTNVTFTKAQQKVVVQERKGVTKMVNEMVHKFKEQERGHVEKKKPSDTMRVMFENVNSLGVFTTGKHRNRKLRQLRHLIKEYEVDVTSFVETQVDWRHANKNRQFDVLFGLGKERRSVAACNRTVTRKYSCRDQAGGVAMMTMGKMSANVKKVDSDPSKLGRYCWTKLGGAGKTTYVMTVYMPCNKKNAKTKKKTVWDQHDTYYTSQGILDKDPCDILFDEVIRQLLEWKRERAEIVLVGDFNEDVYRGKLAKRLAEEDINMDELVLRATGMEIPATHDRGSRALCAAFATKGVECKAAEVLKRHRGVGDHLIILLDLHTKSLVGSTCPRVVPPPGRILRASVHAYKTRYNKVLEQLIDRHRMFDKLAAIMGIPDVAVEEYDERMNKWDKELKEFMIAAENKCRTFKQGHMEWSPTIRMWLARRWVLARVQKFRARKKAWCMCRVKNLQRACRRQGLKMPHNITDAELDLHVKICRQTLTSLSEQAPYLRQCHLIRRRKKALADGDEDRAKDILEIIKRERMKRKFVRLRHATGKSRGSSVMSVQVPVESGADGEMRNCTTQMGIFDAARPVLRTRFTGAMGSPFYSGQLFDDVGFTGDTQFAQQILEGTYEAPEGTDEFTVMLLKECAEMYNKMSREEVATYITVEEYQYYWKRVKERTSSSYSGLHFGHYIAAADSEPLARLHTMKISEAARRGVPLARWGYGVTVLLEKVAGVSIMTKLRAICLFEADFNFWTKLIFAKRMMQKAREDDALPEEVYAKKGSHCDDATMTKVMFCDLSRILRHPAGITEEDLKECYDKMGHGPTSLAMQSWGVPRNACRIVLKALRLMQFCLRTGFGESEEMFGGTEDDPYGGSGQGSGWAPPGFTALSSVAVNAYKRAGGGAKITTPRSGRIFLLAAVMYVDDTDLLHWAPDARTTDTRLIRQIQKEVNLWGEIMQSTGAVLNALKSSLFLLSYKWSNGRARLKKVNELPSIGHEFVVNGPNGEQPVVHPAHVTIPQPDGSNAPIRTHDLKDAVKMLGFYHALDPKEHPHVDAMVKKGVDWVDKIATGNLHPRDVWMGFFAQILPGINWGLVATVLHPQALQDAYQSFYYKLLPILGVNRNIGKEWRTLPERYQGLGLPDFEVHALSKKIHFLQRKWDGKDATSNMTGTTYEAFMIEVGVYGNMFALDWSKYKCLATEHTWYYNLWELCHRLGVTIELEKKQYMGPVREGDKSIIQIAMDRGMGSAQLEMINTVRKHLGLLHVSDLTLCDGKTLCDGLFDQSRDERSQSNFQFPRERPSGKDFRVWKFFVLSLTSDGQTLTQPLGGYVEEPHIPNQWKYDPVRDALLHHDIGSGQQYLYTKDAESRQLRSGQAYMRQDTGADAQSFTDYAAVVDVSADMVKLHSHTPCPTQEGDPELSFLDVIRSYPNQGMWSNMYVDGDGEWVEEAILGGTLDVAHDGSYQPEVSKEVCSTAVWMRCRRTGRTLFLSFAERSPHASSYRSEILGAVAAQLIVKAAARDRTAAYPDVPVYCDNKGVLNHGGEAERELKEKQSQFDVLHVMKVLITASLVGSTFRWVKGHSVKRKGLRKCTVPEIMNDLADNLAGTTLTHAIEAQEFIHSEFPFEKLKVRYNGKKLTGNLRREIDNVRGEQTARTYFAKKGIVSEQNFGRVWWDGMEKLMKSYPKMYRVWLTKHVSGCCGTNKQMSYWKRDWNAMCPSCGAVAETAQHITRCRDAGRRKMLRHSVMNLIEWVGETTGETDMAYALSCYLTAQGERTFDDAAMEMGREARVRWQDLIEETTSLGWDCLVEGRISKVWLEFARYGLAATRNPMGTEGWAKRFVDHLLRITHQQWIYRNYKIHFKSKGGLTLKEHDEIFERMDELLYTDPDELLPQHQHLLLVDKSRLTRGSLSDRQTWITRVEAAMSAKERLCREVMDLEGTEQQGETEVNESGDTRQDRQQE